MLTKDHIEAIWLIKHKRQEGKTGYPLRWATDPMIKMASVDHMYLISVRQRVDVCFNDKEFTESTRFRAMMMSREYTNRNRAS